MFQYIIYNFLTYMFDMKIYENAYGTFTKYRQLVIKM